MSDWNRGLCQIPELQPPEKEDLSCGECDRYGEVPCSHCDNRGYRREDHRRWNGYHWVTVTISCRCDECDGTGNVRCSHWERDL